MVEKSNLVIQAKLKFCKHRPQPTVLAWNRQIALASSMLNLCPQQTSCIVLYTTVFCRLSICFEKSFHVWETTCLDGHLDGQYLRFWPKWVINITKLGMQIHTFWHNPRPPRLKNGLVKRPCLNWKGNVCCFGSVPTHEKEIFGESKIRRDMFVHTAPQQHSKGRYLKQGN